MADYFINKAYNLLYSDLCEMKQVHLNLSKIFGKMVSFLLLLLFTDLWHVIERPSFSLNEIFKEIENRKSWKRLSGTSFIEVLSAFWKITDPKQWNSTSHQSCISFGWTMCQENASGFLCPFTGQLWVTVWTWGNVHLLFHSHSHGSEIFFFFNNA